MLWDIKVTMKKKIKQIKQKMVKLSFPKIQQVASMRLILMWVTVLEIVTDGQNDFSSLICASLMLRFAIFQFGINFQLIVSTVLVKYYSCLELDLLIINDLGLFPVSLVIVLWHFSLLVNFWFVNHISLAY